MLNVIHIVNTKNNYSIYIKGNEKQVFHHRKSTKHKMILQEMGTNTCKAHRKEVVKWPKQVFFIKFSKYK